MLFKFRKLAAFCAAFLLCLSFTGQALITYADDVIPTYEIDYYPEISNKATVFNTLVDNGFSTASALGVLADLLNKSPELDPAYSENDKVGVICADYDSLSAFAEQHGESWPEISLETQILYMVNSMANGGWMNNSVINTYAREYGDDYIFVTYDNFKKLDDVTQAAICFKAGYWGEDSGIATGITGVESAMESFDWTPSLTNIADAAAEQGIEISYTNIINILRLLTNENIAPDGLQVMYGTGDTYLEYLFACSCVNACIAYGYDINLFNWYSTGDSATETEGFNTDTYSLTVSDYAYKYLYYAITNLNTDASGIIRLTDEEKENHSDILYTTKNVTCLDSSYTGQSYGSKYANYCCVTDTGAEEIRRTNLDDIAASVTGLDESFIKLSGTSAVLSYIKEAIEIALDDSHGYSNVSNRGPDYDCGSMISQTLWVTGILPTDVIYEPNDGVQWILSAYGFDIIPYSYENLKPGDILYRYGHTEMYIGNNLMAGAHDDYGYTQSGDQTGDEINIKGLTGDWEYIFRYKY